MKSLAFVAASLFAAAPALAGAQFMIDFEKQWDYLQGDIADYYAGGTAGDGSIGPDRGVAFVNVSGLSNDAQFTYYSAAPSPLGIAYAYSGAGSAYMNVAAGVAGSLRLYYASPADAVGAIKAYSGLGGTGTLLGSFDLAANNAAGYDHWTAVSLDFAGVAKSFDLSGSADLVAIDNISAVPEPASALLLALGGAGIAAAARRRRR